jgi:hypothetical protein
MAALSQLSYSPKLVVDREVYRGFLVVGDRHTARPGAPSTPR